MRRSRIRRSNSRFSSRGTSAARTRTPRALVAQVRPKLSAIPGRLRPELRSALGPRPRRDGRLRIRGRGSAGPRQRRAQRRDPGADRRRAQAARAQPAVSCSPAFSASTPQLYLRPRPHQGEAAGPEPARRVQHAADLSRLALRQRLQPVRPHLPRDVAGRQGRARRRRPTCASSTCATRPGGMVPLSALGTLAADRRPGDRAALQQLCARR